MRRLPGADWGAQLFAYLRGTVAEKTVKGVVLDVNGVGYWILVPQGVHQQLSVDRPALLLTYCHIREDLFQIYGFLRQEERALFELLLGISGVGPKAALSILSTLGVREFGRAIHDSDVAALTKVSGIGKKGAQRIVLEAKAKLGQDAELDAILGETDASGLEDADDVIAALCAMGCTLAEAQKAAAKARAKLNGEATDEEVLKAALRGMAKV